MFTKIATSLRVTRLSEIKVALLVSAALLGTSVPTAAQTVSVNSVIAPNTTSVVAATSVTVTVAGASGDSGDWIGLYPVGSSDGSYVTWSFLNGSHTEPANGLTSASIATYAPISPGQYEWRLYDEFWTHLATSGAVTVTTTTAVLTVNGMTTSVGLGAGAHVSLGLAGGPARADDWVALYAVGAGTWQYLDAKFLNGSVWPPSTGQADASLGFILPTAPGNYQFRLMTGNETLATSGTIAVAASTAELALNGIAPPTAVAVTPGSQITVDVNGGPANAGDWVALYSASTTDPWSYLAFRYLNDTATVPQAGLSAATLHFNAPSVPGTYELRFLTEPGGYSLSDGGLLATRTITVSPATAVVNVNGVSAPATATAGAGTRLTVGVVGGPARADDWVGLYAVGAGTWQYLDRKFLNGSVSPPAVGLSDATVSFIAPTAAGNYQLRLMTLNEAVATSSTVAVSAPIATLAVNGSAGQVSVAAGAQLTVSVNGGPANPGDSVALYAAASTQRWSYLAVRYLNDTQSPPQTGSATGTLHFDAPSTPGTYELRFFSESGGYSLADGGLLATSGHVVVPSTNIHTAAPTITPSTGGTYATPQLVTISTTTADAVIRYTVDGSEPSATSVLYSSAFVIDASVVVKARAFHTDWIDSDTTTATLTIVPGTLSTPVASPGAGWIRPTQAIALVADAGTEIRYTLDGNDPTSGSTLYTGPITIAADNTTLRARAFRTNWTTSAASSGLYRFDTTAPSITTRQFPGPFQGWQLTPVTVTFSCSDDVAVESCPMPVVVNTEGANQIVSAVVIDEAGNQTPVSQTLNLDFTAPLISLTSPAEAISTTDTSIVLTAAVSDGLSGLAGVKCSGVVASVASGQATCTVPLRPGHNDLAVVARDVAGNVRSAGIVVTRTGTSTALTLSPMQQSVLVDEGVTLTLADDFGAEIAGAMWATDDSGIVSVSEDDPPVLTGVAPGTATITVTKNGLSAEATVTVIAGAVFPDGVARWILDGSPGFEYWGVLNANRVDPSVPEMFTIELGSDWMVRGVSALGRAQSVIAAPGYPLMGDSFGGLVSYTGGNSGSSLYGPDNRYTGFARFAGPPNAAPWRYESLDSIGTPAQAPDGTIYVLEKFRVGTNGFQQLAIIETQLVALDGATGLVKSRYTLDRERRNLISNGSVQCAANYEAIPETVGPVVGNDGAGYLLVRTQSQVRTQNCPNVLLSQDIGVKLLRMSPEGETAWTTIYSYHCNRGSIDPEICDQAPQLRDLIPDGAGGVLARVTYTASAVFDFLHGANYTFETRVSRITPEGVQYTNTINRDDYFVPMMAGDDGTALFFTNAAWHLMDVTNWSALWTNPNTRLQPVTATLQRGTAMLDVDSGNLIEFNAAGAPTNSSPFGGTWGYQSAFGLWTSSEWGLTARFSLPLNESATRFGVLGTGQQAPRATTFANREIAALIALEFVYPTSANTNSEYGGLVCREGNGFMWSRLVTDEDQGSVTVPDNLCETGTMAARFHTHPPKELDRPSGGDYPRADQIPNMPNYLMAPIPNTALPNNGLFPTRQQFYKYWKVGNSPSINNVCTRVTLTTWQPFVAGANCNTPIP